MQCARIRSTEPAWYATLLRLCPATRSIRILATSAEIRGHARTKAPTFVRIAVDSERIGADTGRTRASRVQICGNLDQHRPTSPGIDQCLGRFRPMLGRISTTSTRFGPGSTSFGPNSTSIDQPLPTSDQHWLGTDPNVPEFDEGRSSAKIGPISASIDRNWPGIRIPSRCVVSRGSGFALPILGAVATSAHQPNFRTRRRTSFYRPAASPGMSSAPQSGSWPNLADLDRHRRAQRGRFASPGIGRDRPQIGRHRPKLADLAPNRPTLPELGRSRPHNLVRIDRQVPTSTGSGSYFVRRSEKFSAQNLRRCVPTTVLTGELLHSGCPKSEGPNPAPREVLPPKVEPFTVVPRARPPGDCNTTRSAISSTPSPRTRSSASTSAG